MEIIASFEDFLKSGPYDKAVMTIGTFDGLHLGHQALIKQLCMRQKERSLKSFVFTFSNLPKQVLNPNNPPEKLSIHADKLEFFKKIGIDVLVLIDFSKTFANIEHSEFLTKILSRFTYLLLIEGFNFKFGQKNLGTIDYLIKETGNAAFDLEVVGPVYWQHKVISASKIRSTLKKGSLDVANQMLGKPYIIKGVVVEGEKRGRTIGFPTANMIVRDQLLPQEGVYHGIASHDEQEFNAMCFIGKNSFAKHGDDDHFSHLVEVNILDFDKDIYNENLNFTFLNYIRGFIKFQSLDELKAQLIKDRDYCLNKGVNKSSEFKNNSKRRHYQEVSTTQ